MSRETEELQKIIDTHNRIVFFGGAGVSTESGIPDFRSQDGLYNMKYKYPPELIISHTFFVHQPEEFYRFYRDRILITDVEPNPAHKKLAELEAAGKLTAVVTQNIDGLHQKAGAKNVYEIHGSVMRNTCTACGKKYGLEAVLGGEDVPRCICGGIIKPDVTLFEEQLPWDAFLAAQKAIGEADMLIVAGTSLAVQPAASLVRYFNGSPLVIINLTETPADRMADLVIREPVGRVLREAVAKMRPAP